MMPSQGYYKDIIRILYGYGWEGHPIAIGGKGIPFAIWWKGTLLAWVSANMPPSPSCELCALPWWRVASQPVSQPASQPRAEPTSQPASQPTANRICFCRKSPKSAKTLNLNVKHKICYIFIRFSSFLKSQKSGKYTENSKHIMFYC